jgi:hypothetical protein
MDHYYIYIDIDGVCAVRVRIVGRSGPRETAQGSVEKQNYARAAIVLFSTALPGPEMLVATKPPECPPDRRLCATAAASKMPGPGAVRVHGVPVWFPAVSARALPLTFEFTPPNIPAPIPTPRSPVGSQVWRGAL